MSKQSLNLATQLCVALAAVRAYTVRSDSCASLGLGVSEQRALLVLNGKPTRFSVACQKAEIDKGQLSRAFSALKERGLILAKESTTKSRFLQPALYLSLTPAGTRLRATIQRRIARADAEIMRKLTATERAVLPKILAKLAAAMETA